MATIRETLMKNLGFIVMDTGGGCQAYYRDIGKRYIMVTGEGGLDLPESRKENCLVGFYEKETDDQIFTFNCRFETILTAEIDFDTFRFGG